MKKEREDNSLENEPGNNGITFSIDDIPNIYNKAKEISNNVADSTTIDIKGDYREWLIGESQMPYSVLWEFHQEDILISRIVIKLSAGYDLKKGAWSDFSANFWTSDIDQSWDFVEMHDKIHQLLADKGYKSEKHISEIGEHLITIKKDENSSVQTTVNLGHRADDPQWFGEDGVLDRGNNPISVYVGNQHNSIPLSDHDFVENLEFFEDVLPDIAKCFYESFEEDIPALAIEI